MNKKIISIVSLLSISVAAYAASIPAPTAVRNGAAPVTPVPTTVRDGASAVATAPMEEIPVAEAPAADAPAVDAPAAETVAADEQVPANADVTPVAEAPAPAVAPAPSDVVASPAAVRSAPSAPASYPAPVAVRKADPDTLPLVTYYTTSYVPVPTTYVAAESNGDTVTLDELRGYVPFKVAFGVQGFIGSFTLQDYDYYDEGFFDLSLRLGLTSILPLNKYTVAMKIGAIYEQSKASNTFYYYDRRVHTEKSYHLVFKERRINFPVLFSFKSPRSNIMFDFGAQLSLPFYDKLTYSTSDGKVKQKYTVDMIDEDYRCALDWSLVVGMEFRANKNIALNLRFDYGLNSQYNSFDEDDVIKVDGLTSYAILAGLTFYFQ